MGWQTGSQRFRKRVVRERPDLLPSDGQRYALELTCGHVVYREKRGSLAVYCEICRSESTKTSS